MNQDSQLHRATPEQWAELEAVAALCVSSPVRELRARVEQLETALLSLTSTVAKAGNDYKSRIEALELAQRVAVDDLAPAEQAELGVVTAAKFKAAMARAARQGAERAKAQMRNGASWTPPDAISRAEFEAEFTSQYCNAWPDREFEPPANCRQRLQRNGMPYPKSGCDACGNMSPKWRQCDAALARSATIEPPPIASDQDLMKAWHSVPGEGFVAALRAVYSLGRQHNSTGLQQ